MKLGNVLEVLPMLCMKLFWSGLFSFGDVNNVPKHLAKFSLLFEGFETNVLCLSWTTSWEGGSNIVDWQWTYQSALESYMDKCFSCINQGINVVKEQGAMVGPHIMFVTTIAWIAFRRNWVHYDRMVKYYKFSLSLF